MGDAIGKIIEELVELFKRNYRRPRLWLFIAIILFITVLIIPYIDSNFFYFSRMEKRINVLEEVKNYFVLFGGARKRPENQQNFQWIVTSFLYTTTFSIKL